MAKEMIIAGTWTLKVPLRMAHNLLLLCIIYIYIKSALALLFSYPLRSDSLNKEI